jgi:hypothetical protein
MWWEAETSGLFGLGVGAPNDFDAADRADLCKAGGRC